MDAELVLAGQHGRGIAAHRIHISLEDGGPLGGRCGLWMATMVAPARGVPVSSATTVPVRFWPKAAEGKMAKTTVITIISRHVLFM